MPKVVDSNDEVVLVEDLAPIINEEMQKREMTWRREWKSDHPYFTTNVTRRNEFGDKPLQDGIRACSPLERLAFEAGLPDRTVRRILTGESAYVCLDFADKLLMAVDRGLWEVTIYKKQEVNEATVEQSALIRLLSKSWGEFIPPHRKRATGHSAARDAMPRLRKRMAS